MRPPKSGGTKPPALIEQILMKTPRLARCSVYARVGLAISDACQTTRALRTARAPSTPSPGSHELRREASPAAPFLRCREWRSIGARIELEKCPCCRRPLRESEESAF